MTLSQLIDEIVLRAKVIDICPGIQDVRNATTYAELIQAGLDFVEYAYSSGIIDDTLLAEIPESDLNAQGIYTSGTFSLSAIDIKCFFLKNAVVDITYDGFRKGEIVVMGQAEATVLLKDNTYAKISAHNNCEVSVTTQTQAIAELYCRDESVIEINASSFSMVKLLSRGNSIVTLAAIDDTYIRAKTHQFSSLTYSVDDAAQVVTTQYNSSTINEVAP